MTYISHTLWSLVSTQEGVATRTWPQATFLQQQKEHFQSSVFAGHVSCIALVIQI